MTIEILGYAALPVDLKFMKAVAADRDRSVDDMILFVCMLTGLAGVDECGTVSEYGSISQTRLYVRAAKSKVGKLDQTCTPTYALSAFGLGGEYVPSPGILDACAQAEKERENRKADEIDPDATVTETLLGHDNITFKTEIYPVADSKRWFEVSVTITGPKGNRMIGPVKLEVQHKKDVIPAALATVGLGFERKSDEELVFWWYEPNRNLAHLLRSIGWKRVKPFGRF